MRGETWRRLWIALCITSFLLIAYQMLYVLEGELTAYLPGVERVRSGDSMLQPGIDMLGPPGALPDEAAIS